MFVPKHLRGPALYAFAKKVRPGVLIPLAVEWLASRDMACIFVLSFLPSLTVCCLWVFLHSVDILGLPVRCLSLSTLVLPVFLKTSSGFDF